MQSVSEVLKAVKLGKLSLKQAENLLRLDAIAIIDNVARLDYNRYLRRGVPEIIYAQSKTAKQLTLIVRDLAKRYYVNPSRLPIIISKVRSDQVAPLQRMLESHEHRKKLAMKYYPNANMIAVLGKKNPSKQSHRQGRIALLAAGTSDMYALNESEIVLNLFGCRTLRFNDVGVAGLHRLIEPMKQVSDFDPDAIIVAAGMEGALPSVIAGLSSIPVIGLPTSVGYGYGGNGEAALMSMLQACSLGISVVNIDAGVAAGVVAWLISKRKK
ncbi:MAG TPA: nickel pincer cofactor biosynthesis protein LarB [Nitrososphaerales archaeon]|nr:nickel pincer cofactor biosynthesis protein LarB [Nitrososphaerales archaeon]